MVANFNQADYWIKRHKDLHGDPRSVGNLAFSLEQNIKGEVDLKGAVSDVASVLNKRYSTVLDLGCGYGRVAQEFISNGFAYTGIDISQEAIDRARATIPKGTFFQADLGDWEPSQKKFDLVCVMYVFVHFVNDADWNKFIFKAASSVGPNGMLVFADHFPPERSAPVPHVVSRPLSEYEKTFELHDLHLDEGLRQEMLAAFPDRAPLKQFHFAQRN